MSAVGISVKTTKPSAITITPDAVSSPLRSIQEKRTSTAEASIAPSPQNTAMKLNCDQVAPTTVVTQCGPSEPVGGMISVIIRITAATVQRITGCDAV